MDMPIRPTAEPRGASPGPRFHDRVTMRAEDVRAELDRSLSAPAASIAPKHFYDRLGSALFTAICELPEYYPTRTERSILDAARLEIAAAIGPGATLIDLGAGDCAKAARLFAAVEPAQYVAVDISTAFVAAALTALQREHPALDMIGLGIDFTAEVWLPDMVRPERRVFFYPGSSIGNFAPRDAVAFLSRVRERIDPAGGLLIGVDLAKPAAIVEPAYDDALGVTAAFNLNVLNHVNRQLGSDFDPAGWRHVAFLNEADSRIEMHLEARAPTIVSWPGRERRFQAGERILTEWSHKYRLPAFEALLREAGLQPAARWTDPGGWFAVVHAVPAR
jgi:dimethylhistidine N-methyltransferase